MTKKHHFDPTHFQIRAVAAGTAAVVSAFAPQMASAGLMTVTHTVSGLPQNLSQGGPSYSGLFDISALLPSGTTSSFTVQSATVRAFGFSDPDTTTSTQYGGYTQFASGTRNTGFQAYYYYSGGSWLWYYSGSGSYWVSRTATDRYYERSVTEKYIDQVRDAMGLTVGSETFSDTVDTHDTSSSYMGVTSNNYCGGSWAYGYNYCRDVEYSSNDIAYGAVQVIESLSQDSLSDLSTDGQIPFMASATIGQFSLSSLSLEAVVQLSSPTAAAAQVPLPSTLTLFMLPALAGMAYRLRSGGSARRFRRPKTESSPTHL